MAMLPHTMDIILEFEPIVKLVCYEFNCKHNLMNCANDSSKQQASCNLKQITIGNNSATCLNFEARKQV